MRMIALTFVLLAACRSSSSDFCRGPQEVGRIVSGLRIRETRLHVDAAVVANSANAPMRNGLVTIERKPATGICRCCVTFFYGDDGTVKELVIMREAATRLEGQRLAQTLLTAMNLPEPDISAPGEEVALYRWKTPGNASEQLALDISIVEESGGKTAFRAALTLIGGLSLTKGLPKE